MKYTGSLLNKLDLCSCVSACVACYASARMARAMLKTLLELLYGVEGFGTEGERPIGGCCHGAKDFYCRRQACGDGGI